MKQITIDEFKKEYQPIMDESDNTLLASFIYNQAYQYVWEHVWTRMNDNTIQSGMHLANALDYIFTIFQWHENIEVIDSSEDAEEVDDAPDYQQIVKDAVECIIYQRINSYYRFEAKNIYLDQALKFLEAAKIEDIPAFVRNCILRTIKELEVPEEDTIYFLGEYATDQDKIDFPEDFDE